MSRALWLDVEEYMLMLMITISIQFQITGRLFTHCEFDLPPAFFFIHEKFYNVTISCLMNAFLENQSTFRLSIQTDTSLILV